MLSKTSVLTQRLSSSVLQRRCASGVAAVLDSGVSTHKDRNILRESTNDVKWSFKLLKHHVNALATGLNQMGLMAGDKVAVSLPGGMESVVAQLGAAQAGIVLIPFSASASASDVQSVVKTESCKAVLAHSAITSTLAAAVPGLQATPKGATVSSAECPSLKYVIHDGIDPVAGMLNLRNILCYNSSAAVSSSGSGNVIGSVTNEALIAGATAIKDKMKLGLNDRVAVVPNSSVPMGSAMSHAIVACLMSGSVIVPTTSEQLNSVFASEFCTHIVAPPSAFSGIDPATVKSAIFDCDEESATTVAGLSSANFKAGKLQ